jgi:hypothetical protein
LYDPQSNYYKCPRDNAGVMSVESGWEFTGTVPMPGSAIYARIGWAASCLTATGSHAAAKAFPLTRQLTAALGVRTVSIVSAVRHDQRRRQLPDLFEK